MTGFLIAAFALAAAVAAVLAWPALRRRAQAPARLDYDLAVFQDQLREVARDRERGLIDDKEAEAARTEIERRMLAAAGDSAGDGLRPASAAPIEESPAADRKLTRSFVLLVAGLAPAAAFALYLFLGQPGVPDFPHAQRKDEVAAAQSRQAAAERLREQVPDLDNAIARLAQRLEQEPNDVVGWTMLGRSYGALGRFDDAARAWGRAHALSPADAEIALPYAEMLLQTDDARAPAEAARVLGPVLAAKPLDPRARYYVGLARAQGGDIQGAMQAWIDLAALSPADAPWLPVVMDQIGRAGKELGVDPRQTPPSEETLRRVARGEKAQAPDPAPPPAERSAAAPSGPPPLSREQMEAAKDMTPAERETMIRGMVERLAQRLKENPNDREGWLRLARAYEVLGEAEKAKDARAKAAALPAKP